MAKFSSRESITQLTSEERDFEVVKDAQGGEWNVAHMLLGELDEFESSVYPDAKGNRKTEEFRGVVLHICLSDDRGRRLFSESDIPMLHNLPKWVDPVVDEAMRINRLGKYAKDAEKNSETTPPTGAESAPAGSSGPHPASSSAA